MGLNNNTIEYECVEKKMNNNESDWKETGINAIK